MMSVGDSGMGMLSQGHPKRAGADLAALVSGVGGTQVSPKGSLASEPPTKRGKNGSPGRSPRGQFGCRKEMKKNGQECWASWKLSPEFQKEGEVLPAGAGA